MTTGQTHGELWSGGAREWARYIEPHNYPLYQAVHENLGIGRGTRLFDGKDYFTILDFVKAYEHFNDPEWDGEPLDPEPPKGPT